MPALSKSTLIVVLTNFKRAFNKFDASTRAIAGQSIK